LVEGTLVSSSYEREYGKGKKATTVKHTVWQIRADSIRKLNRAEKEPEAIASGSDDTTESRHTSGQEVPF
jgi:single-stranded DNA-binding protein